MDGFKKSVAREYFESLVIAVVLALFIRTFVVQAFKIPTGSMEQNLLIGDHLLVNKFVFGPTAGRIEKTLLPIKELHAFFKDLKLSESENKIAKRILLEINSRLQTMMDVGLGYLALNRLSNSLSGGESQRINLATSLGSSLVGSMYILDEPTTGLHLADVERLLESLNRLVEAGHTVLLIEHHLDVIKAADHVIDLGPEGGHAGGEVVATGTPEDIAACKTSYTGKFLKKHLSNS